MSAPDDDLPFLLHVETAFQITGRGTVVMGVIEHGVLHIGDHLELIQPSGTDAAPPLRLQCLGFDTAPRMTGRGLARRHPVAVFVGPGIEPDAIRAGAKLRAAADNETQ